MISIKFRGINAYVFPNRIKFKTPGLYVYELRNEDEYDTPCTIEENVLVNFWGSIITKRNIHLKDGKIDLTEDEVTEILSNINNPIYELKEFKEK